MTETQEFRLLYTHPCPVTGDELEGECYCSGTGETVRERANAAMDRALEVIEKGWLKIWPALTFHEEFETERIRLDAQAEYVSHWHKEAEE